MRVRAIAATVTLAALLGVGFVGSGDTTDQDVPAGRQVVTFWGTWAGDQQAELQTIIDEYNSDQDTYFVQYSTQPQVEQKMLTGEASGFVPDLVLWDRANTPKYAAKGALTDITPLIERDGVDMSQYYPQAVNELTYDGRIYGVPATVDTRAIFYNKKLFAQAGITSPPTTWDELAADAKKMTVWDGSKLEVSGFALDDAGMFETYCMQAGCHMLNADGTEVAFNSPQGLEVLNFWNELLNQDKVYELGFGDGEDAFAQGKLAMKYDGPWDVTTYNNTPGLDYGVAQPPVGPNGDKGAVMGGFGLVIPNGAKNVEGAWDFMKWWTTNPAIGVQFGKASGWIPANIQASQDPFFTQDPHYAAIIQTLSYATTRSTVNGYADAINLGLTPELQKFMSGEESAQQALDAGEQQANQILARARAGDE